MSAMDPEDALDQLLNSTWSNMAQQLSMLHRSLSADIQQQHRERKAEQAQQARLQAAEIKEMEAQRARLLSWESAHRRELNNGFESVLNATVLGTRGCSPLSDTSLLKAWNVSEMLVGTDPGYAAQLNRARNLMETEWSQRHPGETIGFLCVVYGILVLSDGLFKVQIAVDAKRFGIDRWWAILLAAACAGVLGVLLVLRPGEGAQALTMLLGASLFLDGVMNLLVALLTVKIIRHQQPDVIETDEFEIK